MFNAIQFLNRHGYGKYTKKYDDFCFAVLHNSKFQAILSFILLKYFPSTFINNDNMSSYVKGKSFKRVCRDIKFKQFIDENIKFIQSSSIVLYEIHFILPDMNNIIYIDKTLYESLNEISVKNVLKYVSDKDVKDFVLYTYSSDYSTIFYHFPDKNRFLYFGIDSYLCAENKCFCNCHDNDIMKKIFILSRSNFCIINDNDELKINQEVDVDLLSLFALKYFNRLQVFNNKGKNKEFIIQKNKGDQ